MTLRDLARSDADTSPAFGDSRSRVLSILHDAGQPLGVAQVAERLGVHPNTARFHLDALVEAGVADRTAEERDQPGRPRALYSARPGTAPAGRRNYRLLAEILASFLAAEVANPAQAAQRAGRAWGRYLADRPPPFQRTDADAATAELVAALDEIGFAPEKTTVDDEPRILLHHCPFRETAEGHRDVVCSVHLGLMQGMLAELNAPIDARRLDPFVQPDVCVTHLAVRSEPEGASAEAPQ